MTELTQLERAIDNQLWFDVAMANPRLFKLSARKLKDTCEILLTLGATPREVSQILKRCPTQVIQDPKAFELKCIEWLSFCDQVGIPWTDVLAEVPVVLGLSTIAWRDRIADLGEFFPRSIGSLIVETPSVLIEDWSSLREKIEFLLFTMQVSPAAISRHGALEQDIELLRARYLLLDRSGLYKHPSAKTMEFEDTAKPTINLIVIPSVPKFLKKTTNGCLSVEEYNTFLSLLSLEDAESRVKQEKLAAALPGYESGDDDNESHFV